MGYAFRRVLLNFVVIWLVMTFVFVTVRVLPGDYAAAQVSERYFGGGASAGESPEDALDKARARLGLDDSIPVQYVKYVRDLMTGDLGTSFATGRSVVAEIRHALPYTIQLGTMSMLIAVLISFPVGIISAVRQDSLLDGVLRFFAIGALAAPSFWTATIGTLVVLKYDILELNIVGSPGIWEDPWSSLQLFIIPAVAGGVSSGAIVMRLLRSQLLDVLRQDYVRTALAKGLRERTVILRHAMRNALIPVLTVFGFVFGTLISGSVILEAMFNIPGMGQMMIVSLRSRDVPVVQGLALVVATGVVIVNLVVDLIYLKIDPRISVEGVH